MAMYYVKVTDDEGMVHLISVSDSEYTDQKANKRTNTILEAFDDAGMEVLKLMKVRNKVIK
jgi:hypothetical protein